MKNYYFLFVCFVVLLAVTIHATIAISPRQSALQKNKQMFVAKKATLPPLPSLSPEQTIAQPLLVNSGPIPILTNFFCVKIILPHTNRDFYVQFSSNLINWTNFITLHGGDGWVTVGYLSTNKTGFIRCATTN